MDVRKHTNIKIEKKEVLLESCFPIWGVAEGTQMGKELAMHVL